MVNARAGYAWGALLICRSPMETRMQEPGKFYERVYRTVAAIRPILISSGKKATMPFFERAAKVHIGSFGKGLQ
jgi:hypothetical protein